MKKLLIEESFPTLKTDLTALTAQVGKTGELPPLQDLDTATAIDLRLWNVKYLMQHERQHDAVANLAPARFGLCLLARRGREAVDSLADDRQNLREDRRRDFLLDVLRDIVDVQRIHDGIAEFHPITHDNTHPSILKT